MAIKLKNTVKKFSSTKPAWDELENCIKDHCSEPIKKLIEAGESQDKIKDTVNYIVDHIMEGDSESREFSNRESLIKFLPDNYQSYNRTVDSPYDKFKLSRVPADDATLKSLENGELLGVLKDSPNKFLFKINPQGVYYVIDSQDWRTYYLRPKK